MESEPGRSLILWTVRLSVALYCLAVILRLTKRDESRINWCWCLSCMFCMVHVACAYHFEHKWSQTAALKHTAEMTDRVVGWYWAGGLYVNYLFLIAWGVDCYRCVAGSQTPGIMHAVAAFMMFNATAVFGPTWWWIPTIGFIGAILTLRYQALRRTGL